MEKKYLRLEYYIKGLEVGVQKQILGDLRELPSVTRDIVVKTFADDYINGYDRLLGIRFKTKESLDEYLGEIQSDFDKINLQMTRNNRLPLFSDTKMLLQCWKRMDELLEFLPESVLNAEFNCTSFDDYQPIIVNVREQV